MQCNENETQIYDAKLKSKIFQPTNFHITRWLIQSRIRKQPVLFISIYYVLRQPVTKKKIQFLITYIYTAHMRHKIAPNPDTFYLPQYTARYNIKFHILCVFVCACGCGCVD